MPRWRASASSSAAACFYAWRVCGIRRSAPRWASARARWGNFCAAPWCGSRRCAMSNLDVRHPEDGLLLRYLDGELPGRKARQVRAHLEACWQCRAQVEQLQGAIGECVRYRKDVLAPSQPPPPQAWHSVDFERVEAELAAQSWFIRLARFLSPGWNPGLRWALSGAAVLALCVVL